jgi:F-type H+-transporting ATPase subunit b
VRSAFDLSAEQQAVIQQSINEMISAKIQIRFETEPDTICGIELSANGQKIAWSIADYLGSLEKSIEKLLKEQSEFQGKRVTKPDPNTEPEVEVETAMEAKPQPRHEQKQKSSKKPAAPENAK